MFRRVVGVNVGVVRVGAAPAALLEVDDEVAAAAAATAAAASAKMGKRSGMDVGGARRGAEEDKGSSI